MAQFIQISKSRLYDVNNEADNYWVAYLLPDDKEMPQTINFKDSLEKYNGHYIFAPLAPSQVESDITNFISEIDKWLEKNFSKSRTFVWLLSASPITFGNKNKYACSFAEGLYNNYHLSSDINTPVGDQISLAIPNNTDIDTYEEGLLLKSIHINFTTTPINKGPNIENLHDDTTVLLPFTGDHRGSIIMAGNISADSFAFLTSGFTFSYKDSDEVITNNYPFIDNENIKTPVEFTGAIDPLDPLNANISSNDISSGKLRSLLVPVSNSGKIQELNTLLKSSFGNKLNIISDTKLNENYEPSAGSGAFVFEQCNNQNDIVYLTLAGKFTIIKNKESQNNDILCGLSGTESISYSLDKNNYLLFKIKQPALAPTFPLQESSPVGPPMNKEELLIDDCKTSYLSILSDAKSVHYLAQPEGSNLYGMDTNGSNDNPENMLTHKDVGFAIPSTGSLFIPLATYSDMVSGNGDNTDFKNIQLFEQQILAKVRRQAITDIKPNLSASSLNSLTINEAKPAPDPGSFNTTTPAGLIVNVEGSTGKWNSVLLCQDQDSTQMKFNSPSPQLHQALQTNQLFMVATTNDNLTGFVNEIAIEGWQFKPEVGSGNNYGDYQNVMIFKFCKGSLTELVKKASGWTQSDNFNKSDEIVAVSQWLQDYIQDGIEKSDKGNTLFDKFKSIATNENWNGILFLKAKIEAIPTQLSGMTAGMNTNNFFAHHLGIEISNIDGSDISLKGPSSMFGLINYVDPGYDPRQANSPVPPSSSGDYDFKVLVLKVLFENTSIKHFESKAQLTLNTLFDLPVDHMANPNNVFNTIMLDGSMQQSKDKNGNEHTIYMLDTVDDNIFCFKNPALQRVEIAKVQFNTLSTGDDKNDSDVLSRFDLWGFMDFGVLYGDVDVKNKEGGTSETAFKVYDFFSFGNNYSVDYTNKTVTQETNPRRGLRFSGLGINMSYKKDKPEEPTYTFDTSKITFDMLQSTIRTQISNSPNDVTRDNPVVSLYNNLSLEIDGLLSGDSESLPASKGYLQIGTELRLSGVSDKWTGLQLKISMGTVGELAGKAKLTSHLLLAWTGEGSDSSNIFVGVKLPGSSGGAKMFSLQGILKLSISDIVLNYVDEQSSYLLTLSDIALKFLGILKLPPNGSTSFYLFGNPKAESKSTDLGWYAIYNQDQKK